MSFLVAQHPISHIKRVLKILKCCIKFEGYFDRNDTIYTHKGLVHATRSSSHLLYTSKEGYGILKQQWMPLRASYHPNSCTERVPGIWHFARNLGVVLGRNATVWTRRRSHMLLEALMNIFIHLRNVIKHSSSNVCLSLWHTTPFPVQRGYLKHYILHEIWWVFSAEMTPLRGP